MDIEQTAIIDKAHNALANIITQDMGAYLSPSNEVIPFGLLLRDVLIELGYGVKRAPYLCNDGHAGQRSARPTGDIYIRVGRSI